MYSFSINFYQLKEYYIKNIKSIFSSDDFDQILKYTSKDVQEIKFSHVDFSIISTDMICRAFSQLPDNVNSLVFLSCNLITSKNVDELIQIFKAFPAGIKSLILEMYGDTSANVFIKMFQVLSTKLRILELHTSNFEKKNHQEIVSIFRSFSNELRALSIGSINFFNRSHSELTTLFESLPMNLISLTLNWFPINNLEKNEDYPSIPLYALPRSLIHLSLRGNDLGFIPTKTIIKMFEELSDNLNSLDLSRTKLEKKTTDELIAIISAIPYMTKLYLTHNMIEKRPPNELKHLYQAIGNHVELLYLEPGKAPIILNEPLNTLKQSKCAMQEKIPNNMFPILTVDENKDELGYLIAFERTQRALWRKNPRNYRKDMETFEANLGIVMPDEPSKVVNYLMAYAIKRVAQINNLDPITRRLVYDDYKDGTFPLEINGNSKQQVVCLWTACVLLGSLIPDKKFDHSNFITWKIYDIPSKELGLFSLFSYSSFYHTTFKKLLNKEAIDNYLMHSSTPSQYNESIYDTILSMAPETLSESTKQSESIIDNAGVEVFGPPITPVFLCQLAKEGNLTDIKKYTINEDVINEMVSSAIIGNFSFHASVYNALLVATAYRHFDIVRYFIEEKQADCSVICGSSGDINLIDCARINWWFIPASSETFIQYIEDSWFKYKQKQLAYRFIDNANRTHDDSLAPEQLATLKSTANTESVCLKVAKAYEQTSSTQEILTLLSEAVELKDKYAALELGQRHQIAPTLCNLNASFDAYLKAAQLGEEEALIPLERLAQRASAAQKFELSKMYESFFHNEEKAAYWRDKSMELNNSSLTL